MGVGFIMLHIQLFEEEKEENWERQEKDKEDMKKIKKTKSKLNFQISRDSDSTSKVSCESDSHHKEYDHYNRILVDKLREDLKCEIKRIYKKYRLNYKVIRAIVDLEFNLDLHYSAKVY